MKLPDAWPSIRRMSAFLTPVIFVQANCVRRRIVAANRPKGFQACGMATTAAEHEMRFIAFTITFSKPRSCESAT